MEIEYVGIGYWRGKYVKAGGLRGEIIFQPQGRFFLGRCSLAIEYIKVIYDILARSDGILDSI